MPGNPAPSILAGSVTGVSPVDIWRELRRQGATPVEAAGIMGNMIHESSLDPEANATDSNGYVSYGLDQWNSAPGNYPSAGSLVTGHPRRDMQAQVKFLARTGGFRAASGATAGQAASNFAANYERCVGCQAGGSQNAARVGSANLVAGYARTGKWPGTISPAGSGSSPAGDGGGGGGKAGPGCLISVPSTKLFFFFGPTLGGCIFRKSQARAVVGAMLLGASVPVGLGGVLVVVAGIGLRSGAAQQAIRRVPGVGAAVGAIRP